MWRALQWPSKTTNVRPSGNANTTRFGPHDDFSKFHVYPVTSKGCKHMTPLYSKLLIHTTDWCQIKNREICTYQCQFNTTLDPYQTLCFVHIEQLMVPAKLTLKEHMTHTIIQCKGAIQNTACALKFSLYKANMSKVYQGHWNYGVNSKHLNWTTDTVTSLKPHPIRSESRTSPMITGQLTRKMGILNVRGPHEISENPLILSTKAPIPIYHCFPWKKNTKTLNLSESWYLQQHMSHFYQKTKTRGSTHQWYQSPSQDSNLTWDCSKPPEVKGSNKSWAAIRRMASHR